MNIQEAVRCRTKDKPFITRQSWQADVWKGAGIVIFPTDTPDCCIISSAASKTPAAGGSPKQRICVRMTGL